MLVSEIKWKILIRSRQPILRPPGRSVRRNIMVVFVVLDVVEDNQYKDLVSHILVVLLEKYKLARKIIGRRR